MKVMVKGGNAPLVKSDGRPCGTILVGVAWQNPAADIDVCALICDGSGRVLSDRHFLFWSQPLSPSADAVISAAPVGVAGQVVDRAQLVVNLSTLDPAAERILLSISTLEPGRTLASAGGAGMRVVDLESAGADTLMTYINPSGYSTESCVVAAEVYRRGEEWKLRVIDQGYGEGLAALARQHNVNVQ